MSEHEPGCPCNDADERGCFLISAETHRCVSCTCMQSRANRLRELLERTKEGRRLLREARKRRDAYGAGFAAGLDAAREAVMLHATAGQGAAVPPREFVHTHSLLASIDALKETQ